MRTLLFVILWELICSLMALTGASAYKCLVLQHADGTQTVVGLYKEPRITFDATSFIIHSPVLDVTFPKKNVVKYTFEDRGGDTANETVQPNTLHIEVSALEIRIAGYKEKAPVSLYDISGKKLPVEMKRDEGFLTISLSSLVSGIYIVKIGDQSFKFSKL